jgi:hypothetical protein
MKAILLPETQHQRRGHNFYPPKAVVERIPPLYGTDHIPAEDKMIWLHYFTSNSDWFIAELNPNDGIAFGFACLGGDRQNAEWGYMDLEELEAVRGKVANLPVRGFSIIVERDCHWVRKPAIEAIPWLNSRNY